MRRPLRFTLALSLAWITAAQAQVPNDGDVASPEAIVSAAYESISRAPSEPFDWDRFRSLFLPEAMLLPNIEQTGGDAEVFSTDEFIAWVEGYYTENARVGGPDDQGMVEEAVRNEVLRYGDVAQVFSTYQMHYWENDEILVRGINSFQLVQRDGRWWIVSIVWDDETGAGPIPERFLGDR